MTEREFEAITRQLDRLEDKIDSIERDNQLLSDRLELYCQTGEAQVQSIRAEVAAFQTASQQRIEAVNQQMETFQSSVNQQMETFQSSVNQQMETFQSSVNQQIESMNRQMETFQSSVNQQIEAFQDANKQQLNVSLGVLVTAAITIVVSVVLGMQ